MLEIDAKVVLSWGVPAVERHICILVGGGDVIWVWTRMDSFKVEPKIERDE